MTGNQLILKPFKGNFACDTVVSSLLVAGPSTILSILFLFSSGIFGPGLITCSQQVTKLNGSGNGCDYYKVADYEFVNKYCYGNMVDYDINPITGEVFIETKHTLNYMKLFPYVLFGLALLGGLPKLFWLVTESKRAARTSYLLDGVDEAMSELVAALRDIGMKNIDKYKNPKAENGPRIAKSSVIRRRIRTNTEQSSNHFERANPVDALPGGKLFPDKLLPLLIYDCVNTVMF